MNRKERRRLGLEMVEVLERGHYECRGETVDIAAALSEAVVRTCEYTNRMSAPGFTPGSDRGAAIEVNNESSLEAARRLHTAGHRVAVLNFASAKNPGGGFLNGSRAQEESLAMSSGLYACLVGREMYEFHRPTRGGMYTPWAIYSPGVPVVRDAQGSFLPSPYEVAFITSPAPNAGAALARDPSIGAELRRQLEIRIDRVLSIAAHYEHDAVVLGAWGCGVFKNDPTEVAGIFADALTGRFRGAFESVVFAVLDHSDEQRFIGPFVDRFRAVTPSPA